MPDEIQYNRVADAIKNHNPELNDSEDLASRKASLEDAKVNNNAVVKRLEAQINALKNVPANRIELDRVLDVSSNNIEDDSK